jgi:hypothetical protein
MYVGVFKWQLKNNGKSMKKGKALVRVSGPVAKKEEVFLAAEKIIKALDMGLWDVPKNVKVK